MRRRGRLFLPDRELRSITWLNSWLVDGATIIEVGDDRVSWGAVPNRFPSLLILLVSALPAESLFPVAGWPAPKKVTKNACPAYGPALRRVRSFHHCSRGRLTRVIPGPCKPFAASMPLNPLRSDSTHPPERGGWCRLLTCAKKSKANQATPTAFQATRPPFPVRRLSGGVAQGTRGRTPSEERRTGPPRQGRPFVTAPGAAPERGKSGRRPDPDVGVAFSLVTFSWPDKSNEAKRSNSRRLARRASVASQVTRPGAETRCVSMLDKRF